MEANSDAYSEPCQTSKMKVFTKIVNGFSFLTIFAKISTLDVWQDSEFVSEPSNDLRRKLHLRCLAWSYIHLCFNYFRKAVAYLFNKFDWHIPPYIKQFSTVHGQIQVTLISTYLIMKIIIVFPNHLFLKNMFQSKKVTYTIGDITFSWWISFPLESNETEDQISTK